MASVGPGHRGAKPHGEAQPAATRRVVCAAVGEYYGSKRVVDLHVEDVDGSRIAGAHASGGIAASASDADGLLRAYFRPEGWKRGSEATVTVNAFGYTSASAVVVPALESATPVRVVLPSGALPASHPVADQDPAPVSLRGSLRDARSGRAILKHRVELFGG